MASIFHLKHWKIRIGYRVFWNEKLTKTHSQWWYQGVKVEMQGRKNERNSSYVRLAHTSIFGLCFMTVCLMKSNCYSLINSSLEKADIHSSRNTLKLNNVKNSIEWTCKINCVDIFHAAAKHENVTITNYLRW